MEKTGGRQRREVGLGKESRDRREEEERRKGVKGRGGEISPPLSKVGAYMLSTTVFSYYRHQFVGWLVLSFRFS